MAQSVTIETLVEAALRNAKFENSTIIGPEEARAAVNLAISDYYDVVNRASYSYNRTAVTLSSVTTSSTVTNMYRELGVFRVISGNHLSPIELLDESRRSWVEPNPDTINVVVEYVPSFTDLTAGQSFTYVGHGRQFVE